MKVKIENLYLAEIAKDRPLTGKQEFSDEVIQAFKRRLFQIRTARNTFELRENKSFHFEKLKGKKYEDKYSIRLNRSYRLIFSIDKQGGIEIIYIEEISNHYS